MRKWQSHKIVEAEIITAWADTITYKNVTTGEGADAYRHEVPENFFSRGFPSVGDYLVRYDGGKETEYLSWSPKKAFEEGYTLIDHLDLAPPATTRWEYLIIPLPLHGNNFNDCGKSGWELVAALDEWKPASTHSTKGNRIFVFKRPLVE